MNTLRSIVRDQRLVTVLGFTLACLIGLGYIWAKAGGSIPGAVGAYPYRVSFETSDIKNLHARGEVRIAGVTVGRVESTVLDGKNVRVTLSLDSEAAPLHQGAKVRIGVKSLVGSSYVDLRDGTGARIGSGSALPASDVTQAVDVDEIFKMLDPSTQASLRATVRALGAATKDTGQPLNQTLTGLGEVADPGGNALDALASQSADLSRLSVEAHQLIDALDTGQGQIANLVGDAQRLTGATGAKRTAIEQTVRALPALISNLHRGADSLDALSHPLTPIAADLRAAAPDLNAALNNLPATTRDLDALLPSLGATLDEAPATLTRVAGFDATLRALVPTARATLQDVDPMLAYLAPYGTDLGALFASFGGSFDQVAEDGIMPIRLTATAEGVNSLRGIPIKLPGTGTAWNNPYPSPMTVDQPAPFRGSYPHVQQNGQ